MGDERMDTSKEYIKMCEKAFEVQKDWKHKLFDNVTTKDGNFTGQLIDFHVGHDDIYTILNVRYEANVNINNVVWLPRQDQLQEMLDHCDSLMFWDLCSEPEGWLCLGRDIAEERIYPHDSLDGIKEHHYHKTAEQALLSMLMGEKYSKQWNGEDWEIIK